ncbi:uncharacterized protein KY384_005236 [Bacidia gigantensis]|uniref:uncharacterized protein n=1 Tax=Bacidia gigantensis TaxID=2732470 RepID=UPI001D03CB72|nr:uncharacterized protein KY384_005236 [Bacidia gigantensis]KAG8529755.1 hypothetical protein KY384_005236 [Bacidia gigantensis]
MSDFWLTRVWTAAAKGLVAGKYSVNYRNGSFSSMGDDGNALLIPDYQYVQTINAESAAWVIVVEKEARGYPDISTRSFLGHLSTFYAEKGVEPPIWALVDLDPDGIAIMSTYKYGSINLSHENESLQLPSLQWLGLEWKDIFNSIIADSAQISDRRLSLSGRDRAKAVKMLQNSPPLAEHGAEPKWRRELQVMLFTGAKAEMEILGDNITSLASKLGPVNAPRRW